jgi:hypothetical protein
MTTTMTTVDFRRLWGDALPWDAFVASAERNVDLWLGLYELAHLPDDLVAGARARGPRRLLVIAEDWCGDASSTVPVLVKFAEAVETLEVRIIKRDEHPEVMDQYLTHGARAIPVVIVLDDEFRETGWWGPRPAELQEWIRRNRDTVPKVERTRHSRGWYARDKGRSTIQEVLDRF